MLINASPVVPTFHQKSNVNIDKSKLGVFSKNKQTTFSIPLDSNDNLQSRFDGFDWYQQKIKELFEKTTSSDKHLETQIIELNKRISLMESKQKSDEQFHARSEEYIKIISETSNEISANIKQIKDKAMRLNLKISRVNKKIVDLSEKITCTNYVFSDRKVKSVSSARKMNSKRVKQTNCSKTMNTCALKWKDSRKR